MPTPVPLLSGASYAPTDSPSQYFDYYAEGATYAPTWPRPTQVRVML
jgi:hypothetical protein